MTFHRIEVPVALDNRNGGSRRFETLQILAKVSETTRGRWLCLAGHHFRSFQHSLGLENLMRTADS